MEAVVEGGPAYYPLFFGRIVVSSSQLMHDALAYILVAVLCVGELLFESVLCRGY